MPGAGHSLQITIGTFPRGVMFCFRVITDDTDHIIVITDFLPTPRHSFRLILQPWGLPRSNPYRMLQWFGLGNLSLTLRWRVAKHGKQILFYMRLKRTKALFRKVKLTGEGVKKTTTSCNTIAAKFDPEGPSFCNFPP